MWPWEHLAFGYLLYSVTVRLVDGSRPTAAGAVVLAFATQLPDLIDKPLAWSLGVLPSGVSLGHSVFTFALAGLAVAWAARRRDSPRLGLAFAVGYASHLAGDLLFYYVTGGDLPVRILLWPLVSDPVAERTGLFAETAELFAGFVAYLGTPAGAVYLLLEASLVGGAVAAWVVDGRPGLSLLSRLGSRAVGGPRR